MYTPALPTLLGKGGTTTVLYLGLARERIKRLISMLCKQHNTVPQVTCCLQAVGLVGLI
jgi:hypothetical protein